MLAIGIFNFPNIHTKALRGLFCFLDTTTASTLLQSDCRPLYSFPMVHMDKGGGSNQLPNNRRFGTLVPSLLTSAKFFSFTSALLFFNKLKSQKNSYYKFLSFLFIKIKDKLYFLVLVIQGGCTPVTTCNKLPLVTGAFIFSVFKV